MNFEASFVHCIKTNDVTGIKNLGVDENIANEIFVCDTPVTNENDLNGVSCPSYPTPLIYAVCCRKYNVAKMLIEIGAKIETQVNGWNVLHFAVASKQNDIIDMILKCNKSMANIHTEKYATPLQIAVSTSNVDGVFLLLNAGADPNIANNAGNTPLHYAAVSHSEEIASALIAFGAKKDSKNKKGQTPMDIATEKNNKLIIDILMKDEISKDQVISAHEESLNKKAEAMDKGPAADPESLSSRINSLNQRVSDIESRKYFND